MFTAIIQIIAFLSVFFLVLVAANIISLNTLLLKLIVHVSPRNKEN